MWIALGGSVVGICTYVRTRQKGVERGKGHEGDENLGLFPERKWARTFVKERTSTRVRSVTGARKTEHNTSKHPKSKCWGRKKSSIAETAETCNISKEVQNDGH